MNIPKAKNAVERLHRLLSDPEEGCHTWTLCVAVAFSDLEIALSQQRVVSETCLTECPNCCQVFKQEP